MVQSSINSLENNDPIQPSTSSLHGKQKEMDAIQYTVEKLQKRLEGEAEVGTLNTILTNPMMQALIKMHETMTTTESASTFEPLTNTASLLVRQINDNAERNIDTISSELAELTLLLRLPHITGLLESHDQVAAKNFEPQLPDISENDADFTGDESIKVVRLVKGNEPLGATIAKDDMSDNIVIARILKGGAADRSGLIHVNDILVEVNNVPVRGKQPAEIIQLLSTIRGPLTFRLIPGEIDDNNQNQSQMIIRVHIDYNPHKDILIPCPEAGLPFTKNDILQIVSKDDSAWWQAIILKSSADKGGNGKEHGRAGLIPSAELHSKRLHLRRQASLRTVSVKGSTTSLSSQQRRSRKGAWNRLRSSFRKSNRYTYVDKRADHTKSKEDVRVIMKPIQLDLPVYEEVSLLSPGTSGAKYFRPIVLVGPQGVGRNELKDRLINTNPTYYGVPTPHTSRPKLEEEEDGKEYYFVTREEMEVSIKENKFLEYGEYKGNLYGTSLLAVKDVVDSSQVCILTPYPQALKYLRISELKPYIIFIKPPSLHKLLQDSKKSGNAKPKLTIDRDVNVPFKIDELKDLSQRAEDIENLYSHMFDYTIINNDIDKSFAELKQVVFDVENQPQWVPKKWLD